MLPRGEERTGEVLPIEADQKFIFDMRSKAKKGIADRTGLQVHFREKKREGIANWK